VLGVAEHCGTSSNEQLRHLVVVQILPDRGVRRGAEGLEQERDLLLLDEAAHLLHRFRRAVTVVEADQIDLAAVHAPLLVDHLEVGSLGAADHAKGRGGAAVGHGLADLDLGIGNARGVFRLRCPETPGGKCNGGRSRFPQKTTRNHVLPPLMRLLAVALRLAKSTRRRVKARPAA
jgi:hypothetical protein